MPAFFRIKAIKKVEGQVVVILDRPEFYGTVKFFARENTDFKNDFDVNVFPGYSTYLN